VSTLQSRVSTLESRVMPLQSRVMPARSREIPLAAQSFRVLESGTRVIAGVTRVIGKRTRVIGGSTRRQPGRTVQFTGRRPGHDDRVHRFVHIGQFLVHVEHVRRSEVHLSAARTVEDLYRPARSSSTTRAHHDDDLAPVRSRSAWRSPTPRAGCSSPEAGRRPRCATSPARRTSPCPPSSPELATADPVVRGDQLPGHESSPTTNNGGRAVPSIVPHGQPRRRTRVA
jgi:hypothetical protein